MPDIVLATLNARWSHPALGLRYLAANLGDMRERAIILEFVTSDRPADVVEAILAEAPRLVGLGVYIWNAAPMAEVVGLLKAVRPDLPIVLGGPEVGHPGDEPSFADLADVVVSGEGEEVFPEVCRQILGGFQPPRRARGLPQLETLILPYDLYSAKDLAHRNVYVEASRGCPFQCAFCLSSTDEQVRRFPMDRVLEALDALWRRGACQVRFLDRSFHLAEAERILFFFLDRWEEGAFLHFELVPEQLPDRVRQLVAAFPPGSIQLEVGVQTFDPVVARLANRRMDVDKMAENLRFLREETGVHLHADLIAGLPGQDLASFGQSFDQLCALRPHEIQVGILKRLRGTSIGLLDEAFEVAWNPFPPYDVLRNRDLGFEDLQRLKRFSRYWDLVANSGNFPGILPMILEGGAFSGFMNLSDWIFQETVETAGISLNRLAGLLHRYLVTIRGMDPNACGQRLRADFDQVGRTSIPPFLEIFGGKPSRGGAGRKGLPPRQERHVRG